MNAIVIYESVYGNTKAIAQAVAEGLGDVPVLATADERAARTAADLVVVGGPTHMHGLSTASSRRIAAEAAREDGALHVEARATADPGLRSWLRDVPRTDGGLAAAFDTRADHSPFFTGAASRAIGRRLRRRGYDVLGTESFLVAESEGPLEDGELQRARAWGAELADAFGRAVNGRALRSAGDPG